MRQQLLYAWKIRYMGGKQTNKQKHAHFCYSFYQFIISLIIFYVN